MKTNQPYIFIFLNRVYRSTKLHIDQDKFEKNMFWLLLVLRLLHCQIHVIFLIYYVGGNKNIYTYMQVYQY